MTLDKTVTGLLARKPSVAVVGASDKPGRPADRVGRYLIQAGFRVLPVHPKHPHVWGLTAFASILDLPGPVDIVNLFRAPDFIPAHARETLKMPSLPRVFWMQRGITSPEAREILKQTNVIVVEDLCIMVEHLNLARQ